MSYILTQSHPNRGFQGLVIDREAYVEVPYYDRALFEILNEDTEQYYYCKMEVTVRDKKSYYLLSDSRSIFTILNEFNLMKYADFVIKEVSQCRNASLSRGDFETFVFSPIKSN